MQNLITLFHEAVRGGLTIGRTVIHIGKATVEIVVRVVFPGPTR